MRCAHTFEGQGNVRVVPVLELSDTLGRCRGCQRLGLRVQAVAMLMLSLAHFASPQVTWRQESLGPA